jgi:hypothetical protein
MLQLGGLLIGRLAALIQGNFALHQSRPHIRQNLALPFNFFVNVANFCLLRFNLGLLLAYLTL